MDSADLQADDDELPSIASSFNLLGNFDPSLVTKFIGLQPDRVCLKGERHPLARRIYKTNEWELLSYSEGSLDLPGQIDSLMSRLSGFEKKLSDFLKTQSEVSCYLFCGINSSRITPVTIFDSKVIQFLAQFNGELSLDFTILADDDE